MAQDLDVVVTAAEQARLEAIVGDRNRPLKHVQRVRIVLLSAGRPAGRAWRRSRARWA